MKVLAFDFGASNGRAIVGDFDGKQLKMEVIHRFPNSPVEKDGGLYWDFEKLFGEVKEALTKCGDVASIGVDTWGVDFGLLDKEGNLLRDPRNYRDDYSKPMVAVAQERVGKSELYKKTGIQTMNFNTLFQLLAVNEKEPELMAKVDKFLFMPDLVNYMLTGEKAIEYTIASTSQMVNAKMRDWDYEIIEKAGLNKDIFLPIKKTGETVGELKAEYGHPGVKVIAVGSHDTASAVVSVPFENYGSEAYISSGTWSLMGLELDEPVLNEVSEKFDVTNEGGVGGKIRYLKNIMGLWIIQNIKKELNDEYGFGEMSNMARECADFPSEVDVDRQCFLNPDSMIEAIKEECARTNQPVPESIGEILQCVYTSLSKCYARTVSQIETMQGKVYDSINIVGGGCQDMYLNEMTAKATGKTVFAGPIEATALGNILAQMMGKGVVGTMDEARKIIEDSFEVKTIKA